MTHEQSEAELIQMANSYIEKRILAWHKHHSPPKVTRGDIEHVILTHCSKPFTEGKPSLSDDILALMNQTEKKPEVYKNPVWCNHISWEGYWHHYDGKNAICAPGTWNICPICNAPRPKEEV